MTAGGLTGGTTEGIEMAGLTGTTGGTAAVTSGTAGGTTGGTTEGTGMAGLTGTTGAITSGTGRLIIGPPAQVCAHFNRM